jgi:hypothetical protein
MLHDRGAIIARELIFQKSREHLIAGAASHGGPPVRTVNRCYIL